MKKLPKGWDIFRIYSHETYRGSGKYTNGWNWESPSGDRGPGYTTKAAAEKAASYYVGWFSHEGRSK